ncbi:alpha/beta hydrolase [Enterococcus sp. LJL99]
MKNNYIFLGLVVLSLIASLAACSSKKQNKSENSNKHTTISSSNLIESEKTTTPTLFIHGYGGTKHSLGGMIRRFESQDSAKKELVLTVSDTGEVSADGQLTQTETNPMIQVIFSDNKSHEWNQAEWIKNCLAYLKENEQVTKVNLVTHSMGGVSSLRYLITYGADQNLPVIEKFVAIGSPFNNFVELTEGETVDSVISEGPTIQSERYTDFFNGINVVSKEISVLIIAGDIEDESVSDGVVPVADAMSVVSLLRSNGNKVEEEIFYGKNAQHSQLHENLEVDQLVADFLWK